TAGGLVGLVGARHGRALDHALGDGLEHGVEVGVVAQRKAQAAGHDAQLLVDAPLVDGAVVVDLGALLGLQRLVGLPHAAGIAGVGDEADDTVEDVGEGLATGVHAAVGGL